MTGVQFIKRCAKSARKREQPPSTVQLDGQRLLQTIQKLLLLFYYQLSPAAAPSILTQRVVAAGIKSGALNARHVHWVMLVSAIESVRTSATALLLLIS
jgi:hypothetical protein